MNINQMLEQLKDLSERKNNQAINLQGVSESLSEWNHGYSEGLEYAIEKFEQVMKDRGIVEVEI